MPLTSALSFRQLLLASFLSLALLPGAAFVHALLSLEQLNKQSGDLAKQAVQLTEAGQRLLERTRAMDRSARQFLVLKDPAFRALFARAQQEADKALQILQRSQPELPAAAFTAWQQHSEVASSVLQGMVLGPLRPPKPHESGTFDAAISRLTQINEQLIQASKAQIEARNDASQIEMRQKRQFLLASVLVATGLALLLALLLSHWLSRPLAQIEQVIARLGESRLDLSVQIKGPADMRQLGRQLDWLRLRLQELEADKARFVQHISHELKTPLASLREGIALLREEVLGPLNSAQLEVTQILRQSGLSLQSHIEDLLHYNTEAAQAPQWSRVNILDLLNELLQAQRLQWQARQLQIHIDPHDIEVCTLDARKTQTILSNLLANAIRFSPAGGHIKFSLRHSQQTLQIECSDEGPGIAPQDAPHIFEPFYQGLRQTPCIPAGNGLGLSIVHELAKAQGGQVRLLSSLRGAHFLVELPYVK